MGLRRRQERGEDPAATAVREAAEEAGLVVEVDGVIGRRRHPRTGWSIVHLDCRRVGGGAATVVAPDQLSELRWVPPDAPDQLMPDLFGPVGEHLARSWDPIPGILAG